MKKIFLTLTLSLGLLLTGCSMGNYTATPDCYFNKAIIKKADNTIIIVDVKSYHSGTNSVIIETPNGERFGVAYTDATFYVDNGED